MITLDNGTEFTSRVRVKRVNFPDSRLLSHWRGLYLPVLDLYKETGVEKPPLPLHSLRHTFGTEMAKKVPLPLLKELMGHSSIETIMRYIDVAEGQERDAIADVFGRGSDVGAGKAKPGNS